MRWEEGGGEQRGLMAVEVETRVEGGKPRASTESE